MRFVTIVFTWTGFLVWYVGLAVLIGKLLKRGRINAFGPDPEDLIESDHDHDCVAEARRGR
jgi:hypothetical protein